MVNLEAVDAKVERAHDQLRRLRGEAADFCRERSRLIMPEQCGDRRLWVYRGGQSTLPVRWSVRVGEFAHNLRSALDQLVWQLAAAHGECAGLHGDTSCPGRHSEFPIRVRRDPGRLDAQLCGVGPAAREYIESVQPPRRFHVRDGNHIGAGLGMLRDLCNQDKHQSSMQARARWTGQWPIACRHDSSRRARRRRSMLIRGPPGWWRLWATSCVTARRCSSPPDGRMGSTWSSRSTLASTTCHMHRSVRGVPHPCRRCWRPAWRASRWW